MGKDEVKGGKVEVKELKEDKTEGKRNKERSVRK